MPVTVTSNSRRQFLAGGLAIGAGLIVADVLPTLAEPPRTADPDRFVVFSDTHISANPDQDERDIVMSAHLRAAVAGVLAAGVGDRLPSWLLVNGDLAWHEGLAGDYAQFLSLMKPIVDAGIPLTLGLGNHDHRERFWQAVPAALGAPAVVEGRHVKVIESPRATWIVLDTLDVVNATPGLLGAAQLKWLETYLDAHPTRPILVMTHHQPERHRPGQQPAGQQSWPSGIVDGPELVELLLPRKQVKALIYGHVHRWGVLQFEGLQLVSLPAVAYVFSKDQPSGWTDWRLTDAGARITLNTLDPKHPKSGQTVDLAWR